MQARDVHARRARARAHRRLDMQATGNMQDARRKTRSSTFEYRTGRADRVDEPAGLFGPEDLREDEDPPHRAAEDPAAWRKMMHLDFSELEARDC